MRIDTSGVPDGWKLIKAFPRNLAAVDVPPERMVKARFDMPASRKIHDDPAPDGENVMATFPLRVTATPTDTAAPYRIYGTSAALIADQAPFV